MATWATISELTSPSGGVFDFPSLSLGGYALVQMILSGVTVTTDGTDPIVTCYVGGVEQTSGYRWGNQNNHSNTSLAGLDDGSTAAAGILLTSNNADWDIGNNANYSFGGLVQFDAPASTALYKKANIEATCNGPSGRINVVSGIGLLENAGAINGFKVAGTSALTGGIVTLLGRA